MTYSPQKGWSTTKAFKGPRPSIESLAVQYQYAAGQSVTMTIDHEDANLATLSVSLDGADDGNNDADADGQPHPDSDVWSLSGSDIALSLYTHPLLRHCADNFPEQYKWMRENIPIMEAKGTWKAVLESYTHVGGGHDIVRKVLNAMMNGMDSYRKSTWVLKRTRTVASSKEGEIAMYGINWIFDYNTMISSEGLPSSLRFGLDTNLEWLKSTPSISINGTKMTVENTYEGADDFNDDFYTRA